MRAPIGAKAVSTKKGISREESVPLPFESAAGQLMHGISSREKPLLKIVGFYLKGEKYYDKNFTNSFHLGMIALSNALKINRMREISKIIVINKDDKHKSSGVRGHEYREINGGWVYVKGANAFRYGVVKRIADELNWICYPIYE